MRCTVHCTHDLCCIFFVPSFFVSFVWSLPWIFFSIQLFIISFVLRHIFFFYHAVDSYYTLQFFSVSIYPTLARCCLFCGYSIHILQLVKCTTATGNLKIHDSGFFSESLVLGSSMKCLQPAKKRVPTIGQLAAHSSAVRLKGISHRYMLSYYRTKTNEMRANGNCRWLEEQIGFSLQQIPFLHSSHFQFISMINGDKICWNNKTSKFPIVFFSFSSLFAFGISPGLLSDQIQMPNNKWNFGCKLQQNIQFGEKTNKEWEEQRDKHIQNKCFPTNLCEKWFIRIEQLINVTKQLRFTVSLSVCVRICLWF